MNLFEALIGASPPQQPKQPPPSITYGMLENLYRTDQKLFCENYDIIMKTGVPKFSNEQMNNLKFMMLNIEGDKWVDKL